MTKEELRELLISYEVWRGKNYNRFAGYSTHNRPVDMFISENAQRLLLSSEAEKGEKDAVTELRGALVEVLAEIEYQHQDMLSEKERNHPRGSGWARVYDRANAALKRIDNPSPPSPQEKPEGRMWITNTPDQISDCSMSLPAAPDKGEEKAIAQIKDAQNTMHSLYERQPEEEASAPSVEKSEGEEARKHIDSIFERLAGTNYFENDLLYTLVKSEDQYYAARALFREGFYAAKKEYAHSSGDRGAKPKILKTAPTQPPKITNLNNPPVELKNPKNP